MNTSVAQTLSLKEASVETLVSVNKIYLQKRLRIIVPEGKGSGKHPRNREMAATFNKNLEDLGYTFSENLFKAVGRCEVCEIEKLYKELIPILKEMRGANIRFRPMYPNFPRQVIEASYLELYVNAIYHYWSGGTWTPEYAKEARFPSLENHKLDIIELGNNDDFKSIFSSLLGSNTSLSQSDKDIIEWFVRVYRDRINLLTIPSNIPQKENLCFFVGKILHYCEEKNKLNLSQYLRTATDVLRLAVVLSGGDVSLAENTKFKKFNRRERRFILNSLENIKNIQDDIARYPERWLRLGEMIHPGEYAKRYPNTFKIFKDLRSNTKFETFNSKVEKALKVGGIFDATELLSTRPGDFARRLDHLFRKSGKTHQSNKIVFEFLAVADKVSTPVLLQVYSHFKNRCALGDDRVFFPKGQLAKLKVVKNTLPIIEQKFCLNFAKQVQNILIKRFAKLPPLGNVFLDDSLKNYLVPFSQRSASKALKTIVRGSRVPLDQDYDTIRFFIHWSNLKTCNGLDQYMNPGRVDIDLTAAILNANFHGIVDISYYNLKDFSGHHSGDIVNAPLPKGASEFIDISLSKVLQMGGRYIVMCVNSYTQTPLCNLPVCSAGWMGRKHPNSGEIFEPKTVKNRFDLSSNTTVAIPLLVDCENREIIWQDIALKQRPTFNNVSANRNNINLLCKAIAGLKKPNLYDLLMIHVKGRNGNLVKDVKKATYVFDESFASELDKIASEYMM
jgi:hypothetical protein